MFVVAHDDLERLMTDLDSLIQLCFLRLGLAQYPIPLPNLMRGNEARPRM